MRPCFGVKGSVCRHRASSVGLPSAEQLFDPFPGPADDGFGLAHCLLVLLVADCHHLWVAVEAVAALSGVGAQAARRFDIGGDCLAGFLCRVQQQADVVDRREAVSAGDDDALDRVLGGVVRLLAQDPPASALVGARVVESFARLL